MRGRSRVLVLGGTTEGRELANRLRELRQHDVVYSIAGVTHAARLPDCPIRKGGFGGIEGLSNYLTETNVDFVIDATHPFAAQMPTHAKSACDLNGVAHARLERPHWTPCASDRWTIVGDVSKAARHISEHAKRCLLTIGSRDLEPFLSVEGCQFIVRSIEPPSLPLPGTRFEWLQARGPFSLIDEKALLKRWQVDHLVTKNSGGRATQAKLDAARQLGVDVVVIDRPKRPAMNSFTTVEAVTSWLGHLTLQN